MGVLELWLIIVWNSSMVSLMIVFLYDEENLEEKNKIRPDIQMLCILDYKCWTMIENRKSILNG
jgi:hypothetical protein